VRDLLKNTLKRGGGTLINLESPLFLLLFTPGGSHFEGKSLTEWTWERARVKPVAKNACLGCGKLAYLTEGRTPSHRVWGGGTPNWGGLGYCPHHLIGAMEKEWYCYRSFDSSGGGGMSWAPEGVQERKGRGHLSALGKKWCLHDLEGGKGGTGGRGP